MGQVVLRLTSLSADVEVRQSTPSYLEPHKSWGLEAIQDKGNTLEKGLV